MGLSSDKTKHDPIKKHIEIKQIITLFVSLLIDLIDESSILNLNSNFVLLELELSCSDFFTI